MLATSKTQESAPSDIWRRRQDNNIHTHLRTLFLLVSLGWCPGRDLNPHSACAKKDFKSFASANFATRACCFQKLPILDVLPKASLRIMRNSRAGKTETRTHWNVSGRSW